MSERPKAIRCAVYTRKSTERNLDLEFNSLHAQREVCEAYIKSQMHEGWQLIPDAYDDGGISGGSLDRPNLKRLLADIAAGKVDRRWVDRLAEGNDLRTIAYEEGKGSARSVCLSRRRLFPPRPSEI